MNRAIVMLTTGLAAATLVAACGSLANTPTPTASSRAPVATPTPTATTAYVAGTWTGQYSGPFNGTFTLTWTQTGSTVSGTIKLSSPRSKPCVSAGTCPATRSASVRWAWSPTRERSPPTTCPGRTPTRRTARQAPGAPARQTNDHVRRLTCAAPPWRGRRRSRISCRARRPRWGCIDEGRRSPVRWSSGPSGGDTCRFGWRSQSRGVEGHLQSGEGVYKGKISPKTRPSRRGPTGGPSPAAEPSRSRAANRTTPLNRPFRSPDPRHPDRNWIRNVPLAP